MIFRAHTDTEDAEQKQRLNLFDNGKLSSSHELSPIAFTSINDCFTFRIFFYSFRVFCCCCCLCLNASILLIGIRVDFHFRDESHFIVIIFIEIWIIFGVIFLFCIEITWWKSNIIIFPPSKSPDNWNAFFTSNKNGYVIYEIWI